MDGRWEQFINQHLNSLVKFTDCNVTLTTVLIANSVLGDDDIAHLDSIQNKMKKSYEFYNILKRKNGAIPHLIEALTESNNTGALAIFQKHSKERDSLSGLDDDSTTETSAEQITAHSQTKPIRFDVLSPIRLFTGRVKELETLHEKLQQSEQKLAIVSQMASIVGLGGIGKSELARRYIQEYSKKYYRNVIWISAQTEETLKQSFRRLASDHLALSLLNIDGKEKAITSLIDEVYDYFQGKKCLFVFDNAESNECLQKFMPFRISHRPYLLITSRDKEWAFSSEVLPLYELAQEEAIEFVKNGLQMEQNEDESITQLVTTLQCFPLALSQAISYIKQQQSIFPFTIGQYLKQFEVRSQKLLNSSIPPTEFNTYLSTTLRTWKMTADLIASIDESGSEAIRMLNIISYFEPDKIPTRLACGEMGDLDALHLLVKYSMVNSQPAEQTISIHRLVQEVTRIELKRTKNEEETLRNALKLLSENIELDTISHVYSAYTYSSTFPSVVVEYKEIPWRILDKFQLTKKYYDVSNNGSKLQELLLRHVSPEDADAIRLERRMAWGEYEVGNFDNSLKLLKKVLPKYLEDKSNFFTDHEKLRVQNDLALTFKALGNGIECLEIQQLIFGRMRQLYGMDDWRTVETLVDLAHSFNNLGYFDESSKHQAGNQSNVQLRLEIEPTEITSLMKLAYETKKQVLGKNLEWTTVMRNVAAFLYKIGDFELTRAISSDIYERGKTSSANLINVIHSLNLLALLKSEEGNYEEALKMYKNAETLYMTVLGEHHPDTLVFRRNMLMALRNLNDADKALKGFEEVLEKLQRHYPNHPDVVETETQIAVTLFKMGKYEDSLEKFIELKAKLEERFGMDDPQLVNVIKWVDYVQGYVHE
ncbi:unnamed protein product [Orchesella dallaii]|uniref:NB-ARC domain-containing protein n=1 Tax=Orchesella dallaii TaxID=48710 RepID=A0ABP1RHC8_9HEXA